LPHALEKNDLLPARSQIQTCESRTGVVYRDDNVSVWAGVTYVGVFVSRKKTKETTHVREKFNDVGNAAGFGIVREKNNEVPAGWPAVSIERIPNCSAPHAIPFPTPPPSGLPRSNNRDLPAAIARSSLSARAALREQ